MSGPPKRKKIGDLVRAENDALQSFMNMTSSGKESSRDATNTLKLAVPISEPTPAVAKLQAQGVGQSINAMTGKVSKVSRGKNATKGRATVARAETLTLDENELESVVSKDKRKKRARENEDVDCDNSNPPLDFGDDEDVPLDLTSAMHIEDHETIPTTAVQTGLSVHVDEEEDHAILVETERVDALTKENRQAKIQRLTNLVDMPSHLVDIAHVVEAGGDSLVGSDHGRGKKVRVGKPNYVDETQCFASVRSLRKKLLHQKMPAKDIPKFYYRRTQQPEPCLLQRDAKEGNFGVIAPDVETWCKLLTFHADGSFEWPRSSPHLCWNCCHGFSGPPAMIPRSFNRIHQFYEVYGNFCSWACAKRYSLHDRSEYFSEMAPSLDFFAHKYFGHSAPLHPAPPRILLASFSSFGLTIDQYRRGSLWTPLDPPVGSFVATGDSSTYNIDDSGNVGKEEFDGIVAPGFTFMTPPFVPFEMEVMWDKRVSDKRNMRKGYAKDIKDRFEKQMAGDIPLPPMPEAIAKDALTITDSFKGTYKSVPKPPAAGKKKKAQQKDIFSLFA